MVEPINIGDQRQEISVEDLELSLRHEVGLASRLPNIDDKVRHLEGIA